MLTLNKKGSQNSASPLHMSEILIKIYRNVGIHSMFKCDVELRLCISHDRKRGHFTLCKKADGTRFNFFLRHTPGNFTLDKQFVYMIRGRWMRVTGFVKNSK
uniref:Uncharacterized protein n=1 Tax=Halalkalibacterium halodurans TaxID=86665 RepID=A0A0M0KIB6_ALKHA